MTDRIAALERLLQSRPDDARLRFGLALEYEKVGRTDDAVRAMEEYLGRSEDEGNGWGRLGAMLATLGRVEEARGAYGRGIAQAEKHGHPSLAEELRSTLDEL